MKDKMETRKASELLKDPRVFNYFSLVVSIEFKKRFTTQWFDNHSQLFNHDPREMLEFTTYFIGWEECLNTAMEKLEIPNITWDPEFQSQIMTSLLDELYMYHLSDYLASVMVDINIKEN